MSRPEPPSRFRAVKAEILRRVRARDWAPGDLLPAETELAAEFGCARATVNRAMRELAEAGVLDRKRRAGTRVSTAPVRPARFDIPQTRAEVEQTGATYAYRLLRREEVVAPDWLARLWALPETAAVAHVEALHLADGRPWQFEDRWINLAVVPAASEEDFKTVGPNEWLIAALPFSEAEMVFSAASADAALAHALGLAGGDPIFRAERTTWLEGQPVTYARLSYPSTYRMTTRL